MNSPTSIPRTRHIGITWIACLSLALCLTVGRLQAGEPDASGLVGVAQVNVVVEGISPDFARYGLKADELKRRIESRLRAANINVVSQSTSASEPATSQLALKLTANADANAFYFYGLSMQLKRKLMLGNGDQAFIPQKVWSRGKSGVLNPSDFRRIYDFAEELAERFISDHGRVNLGLGDTGYKVASR